MRTESLDHIRRFPFDRPTSEGVRMIKRYPLFLSAVAFLALGALFLSACGDDDNSSGGSGGSDADYVAATCKAQSEFIKAISAIDDPSTDAAKTKGIAAISGLATAMGKMKPPSDAKDYHDKIVKFL